MLLKYRFIATEFKYYVFYKPYNVLNQFSKEREDHVTLADFLRVEKDVYPIGRLDKDSEGLLILTNDKSLNNRLLSPVNKHKRCYFVQLDDTVSDKAIATVSKGVEIKVESGIYFTAPCSVKRLSKPPVLPERNPPIRVRQNIPTSWALIELSEGKNRQVRKMFAAVGYPVLRLVRVQIEDVKLGKLEPGKYMELKQEEIYPLLKLEPLPKVNNSTSTKRDKEGISRSTPGEKNFKTSDSKPKKAKTMKEGKYTNAPKKKTITDKKEQKSSISTASPKNEKKDPALKPKRKPPTGHAPWQKPKTRRS